jgi:hypothetical protein
VPADLRLVKLKTATLRVDQASLTGESVAVAKRTEPINDEGAELQAQECMIFAGTTVSNGQAVGIVNSTGMATQIGCVCAALPNVAPAATVLITQTDAHLCASLCLRNSAIQASISAAKEEEEDTPLKKKLDEFGDTLTKCISAICVLVWLTNYKSFIHWEYKPDSYLPDFSTFTFSLTKCTYYFKIAVALAVAAIPEGLPAVITTCLALGTRKMAKKNAIVRKLASVETLGCTTVICSDKTGTLTTNQMSAVRLVTLNGSLPKTPSDLRRFEVQGTTYNPEEGDIVGLRDLDASLETAAAVCALCNEARIEWRADKGAYVCVGEPTEGALKVLVEKMGAPSAAQNKAIANARARDRAAAAEGACAVYAASERKLALLEFDRSRKSMSVLVAPVGGGPNRLLVKGASECVLERCTHAMLADGTRVTLTKAAKAALLLQASDMAADALRVLSFAVKEGKELGELASYSGEAHPAHKALQAPEKYGASLRHSLRLSAAACSLVLHACACARTHATPHATDEIESGLTFVGLAGLRDPPRPEVRGAMEECRMAVRGAAAHARVCAVHPTVSDASFARLTHEFAGHPRDCHHGRQQADRGGHLQGDPRVRGRRGHGGQEHDGPRVRGAARQGAGQGALRGRRRPRVQPRRAASQAGHCAPAEGPWRDCGHDGRRRQRRACAQAGQHRHCHGHLRHRGGQGGVRHGARGRQLQHHCCRRGGGPCHLHEHEGLHPVRDAPASAAACSALFALRAGGDEYFKSNAEALGRCGDTTTSFLKLIPATRSALWHARAFSPADARAYLSAIRFAAT